MRVRNGFGNGYSNTRAHGRVRRARGNPSLTFTRPPYTIRRTPGRIRLMETRNGTANGRATLGDIHGNKARVTGLMDLNATRDQLERVKADLSAEKNAKEVLRTELFDIMRMVGGAGYSEPGDVKAAVQRKLDRYSNGRAAEFETQLAKQDEVEKQL